MKKIIHYARLVRWPNLLIMAAIFVVLRYGFLIPLGFEVYLTATWHSFLILAIIMIAGGGNAVNDAFDVTADAINKPHKQIVNKHIPHDIALFTGQLLLLTGVILGLAVGYFNNMLTFGYIFPLCALLLWSYASYLKKQPLIGNLIVALLAGILVLLEIVFDLLKTLSVENAAYQQQAIMIITVIAGFSFFTTLVRELIKDLQDVAGDRAAGYKTLPITSGTLFPKILVIILIMIISVAVGWLVLQTFAGGDYGSAIYLVLTVISPLLYIMLKIAPAQSPSKFAHLSLLMKVVMVSGILAVWIFTLSYQMNLPEPEPKYDINIGVGG